MQTILKIASCLFLIIFLYGCDTLYHEDVCKNLQHEISIRDKHFFQLQPNQSLQPFKTTLYQQAIPSPALKTDQYEREYKEMDCDDALPHHFLH